MFAGGTAQAGPPRFALGPRSGLSLRLVLLDLALVLFGVLLATAGGGASMRQRFLVAASFLGIAALLMLAFGTFVRASDRLRYGRFGSVRTQALVASCLALPLSLVLVLEGATVREHGAWILAAAVLGGTLAFLATLRTHPGSNSLTARKRVIIFGCGSAAVDAEISLRGVGRRVEVVGFYPTQGEDASCVSPGRILPASRSLTETARDLEIDEIVIAVTQRRGGVLPLRELLDCKLYGVRVLDLSSYFEMWAGQIRIESLKASWLIFGPGFRQDAVRRISKNLFDIACAAVLLLLAAPVMILAALAIFMETGAPIFYSQERVGLNGRTFRVLKFRSMRIDAEKDGKPRWATNKDDRITRVGRVIRRLRIDELPQLLGVLFGQMSLVGPRPERPFFVDQLTQEIPYYSVRHSIKPGLTGWAQVRYHYGTSVRDAQEKLQYDLYYVKNHTLLLDTLILFETVIVVLTGRGAN